MKNIKVQTKELAENQEHILIAIKNLNERLEAIEGKTDDDNLENLKDILNSQTMIDEIIVKNSDDILRMKRTKDENKVKLEVLESRINIADKEIAQIIQEKLNDKFNKNVKNDV